MQLLRYRKRQVPQRSRVSYLPVRWHGVMHLGANAILLQLCPKRIAVGMSDHEQMPGIGIYGVGGW